MPNLIEGLVHENLEVAAKILDNEKLLSSGDYAYFKSIPPSKKYKQAVVITHSLYRTISVTPKAFYTIKDTLSRHLEIGH